jgi:DNA adenine methylase
MKPLIKWIGGKSKLLTSIIDILLDDYNYYHEIFVGGGALFFHLKPLHANINDFNETLSNLYFILQDEFSTIELCKLYSSLCQIYLFSDDIELKKEKYLLFRKEFNLSKDVLKKTALFLFLNKTGFSGLYRENSKGEFNVPFGKYENPAFIQTEDFFQYHDLLKNTHVFSLDFRDYNHCAEGDLVYLDPPYVPLSNTANFTSYTKSGFNFQDHLDLLEFVNRLNSQKVKFILSLGHNDDLINLYEKENYKIKNLSTVRNLNAKYCSHAREYLIYNY